MQLSWTGLKISIAGARLSHLAQKDKVWDSGSMIEHVRTVFQQLEKAKRKAQLKTVEKYMTVRSFECFEKNCNTAKSNSVRMLKQVFILDVRLKNKKKPDRFCSLLKGLETRLDNIIPFVVSETGRNFSERWLFIRQGEWWILDEIKSDNSKLKNIHLLKYFL